MMDELAKRSVRFIHRCLASDSSFVKSVANGIYIGRMRSPSGRNVFSCTRYGVTTDDITYYSQTLLVFSAIVVSELVLNCYIRLLFCLNSYVFETVHLTQTFRIIVY